MSLQLGWLYREQTTITSFSTDRQHAGLFNRLVECSQTVLLREALTDEQRT